MIWFRKSRKLEGDHYVTKLEPVYDLPYANGPCENVIDIAAQEPHINFYCTGRVHVVPMSVIRNIAENKIPIEQLDGWQEIVRLMFLEKSKWSE